MYSLQESGECTVPWTSRNDHLWAVAVLAKKIWGGRAPSEHCVVRRNNK